MSETSQHLSIKIGKRHWLLIVVHSIGPPSNLRNLLEDDNQPDLCVVRELDEDLREQWIAAVAAQCGKEWETRFITASLTNLDQSLSGPFLVVGPRPMLRRFCDLIAPNEEVPTDSSKNDASKSKLRTYLPDPSEVPRFPNEEYLDPFGQNLDLLEASWSRTAKLVLKLARMAHVQEIAITLPYSPSGQAKSPLKPWRTVVSLQSSSDDQSPIESARQSSLSLPNIKEADFGLDLIQRFLLTLTTFTSDGTTTNEWSKAAELIEDLGFILVSHGIDIKLCPKILTACFQLGEFAAEMHSLNGIHGDLHPGNFVYNPDDQNSEVKIFVIDWATVRRLNRPITILERAMDLAVTKLHCAFLQWEAIKLGYRSIAPKEAEEVFQLL